MNYRMVLSFLWSFVCAQSFASEAPKVDLVKYTQRCFVNYSLSGYFDFKHVTCGNAKAVFAAMIKDEKSKKIINQFQICFVSDRGVKQCAMSHQDTLCDNAIAEIAKAQAVSKKD